MVKLIKRIPNRNPIIRDAPYVELLTRLRFGGTLPHARPLLGYTSISRLTGISTSHVRHILKKETRPLHSLQEEYKNHWRKLNTEQIRFLVSEDTLHEWAPYTLQQRAVFFHRKYPEAHTSASTIRRIYMQHGVKYKVIRRGKKRIDLGSEPYKSLLVELKEKINRVLEQKLPMIFADEAVFTFNTFQSRAWSQKGSNLEIEERLTSLKAQAVIAGYSMEGSLDGLLIQARSIKSNEFIHFLEMVSVKHGGRRVAVFLDNLRVHKSFTVMRAYQRLNIEPIFNLPYSPQYNGIENIFSAVKSHYKKLLLETIVNGRFIRVRELIQQAFRQITQLKAQNCLRHSLSELEKSSQ